MYVSKTEARPEAKPALPRPARQAPPRPVPKGDPPDYTVGERLRTSKYGIGEVISIDPAGADYEVTIHFATAGRKKFMAHFLQYTKVE